MLSKKEIGGIIGSKYENIVTDYVIDYGIKDDNCICSYYPNTEYLNKQISIWQEHNISFMGIFHIHFAKEGTLSENDKEYINCIMEAMPSSIDKLYFPIVLLPEKIIVPYRAERYGKKNIKKDEIIYVEEETK